MVRISWYLVTETVLCPYHMGNHSGERRVVRERHWAIFTEARELVKLNQPGHTPCMLIIILITIIIIIIRRRMHKVHTCILSMHTREI